MKRIAPLDQLISAEAVIQRTSTLGAIESRFAAQHRQTSNWPRRLKSTCRFPT